MTSPLLYRAGHRARTLIQRDGLTPALIRAVVGSASGPRWLALAGLDLALVELGLVGRREDRLLLVGASAGAWRMMALASVDPAATHRRLAAGYIGRVFPRGVGAAEVSASFAAMLAEVFTEADRARMLDHERADLAIHVTRCRGPVGVRGVVAEGLAMLAAATLNRWSPTAIGALFQRVLVHSAPERLETVFPGPVVPLTETNLIPTALATGSVPVYMTGERDLLEAPSGRYIDGGVGDYHLNHGWLEGRPGVVLFPHFQERICGNWFDRSLARRQPPAEVLADVLQIYPSDGYLAELPGGRVPEREDFKTFIDAPEERLRRWTEALAMSECLGRQLLEDLRSGDLAARVAPIPTTR